MSSYGVISTGFLVKTLTNILDEINQAQKDDISAGLNQSAPSVLGQINGITADQIAELWEVAGAISDSLDPATADGQALNNILALNGLTRLPAAASTASVNFVTTGAVTIAAGAVVSVVGSPDLKFTTDAEAIILSATTTAIPVTATVTGPIEAAINTITVLETTIPEVSSITNPAVATIGRNIETDAEARLRLSTAFSTTGSATVDSIRSALIEAGAGDANVFENTTSATVDGIPPHAFEALVPAGELTDDVIAQVLWDNKPAGILSHSSTADSGTAVDATGANQTVAFSRSTNVELYVDVSVSVDATYAGDTAVQDAIKLYIDGLGIGDDFIISKCSCVISEVTGVLDVTVIEVEDSASPSATVNFVIADREQAQMTTASTQVVVTQV